jgi:hypothetical protein
MPVRMKTWINEFRWRLDPNGKPIAPVYELGAVEKPIYYCQCSLCGCIHELPHNQPPRGLYTPRCLLIEFTYVGGSQKTQWQAVLVDWYKKFPQAESQAYQQVYLTPAVELPRALPKKATATEPEPNEIEVAA